MPETVEITVYRFDELNDDSKTRARDWYRTGAFDYPWFESRFDEFEAVCRLLGVDLRTSAVPLMGGGTRKRPNIFFRGFWSQGDGASFEGHYRYRKGADADLRLQYPKDTELLGIADRITNIQRRNFYQLEATIDRRGRYCHEYSMIIDVERSSAQGQEPTPDADDILREAMRDLAHWFYRGLEHEFEYLNSDEAIDAALIANDWRFTEGGTVHG